MVVSKKPSKQRKARLEKELHLARKNLGVHLSKELRKEIGKRALPVRVNDRVKVLKGKQRGFIGKVTKTDALNGFVFIEKLLRKKADGREILVPVQASNLLLTEIDRSDVRRLGKGKPAKAAEKKPVEKGVGKKQAAKPVAKKDIWEEETPVEKK